MVTKPFTVRPYDPSREDKRTAKQKAATQRNFLIFRLRGLWSLAYILTEPTRSTVQALIDYELTKFGALSMREAAAERRRKDRQRYPVEIDPTDLPF